MRRPPASLSPPVPRDGGTAGGRQKGYMEQTVQNGNRINLRTEGKRFAKFLAVGTIGAVVDFGTFNLLTGLFGFPPVPSSVCSFLAAVTSNFVFNRYWTYPDSRSKHVMHQAAQFTAINLVGLLIRTPLFAALIPVWDATLASARFPLPVSGDQLSHNFALACAVLVVLVWNFVVNRFWTYNDVS
jgi:putative flippase GtrA